MFNFLRKGRLSGRSHLSNLRTWQPGEDVHCQRHQQEERERQQEAVQGAQHVAQHGLTGLC